MKRKLNEEEQEITFNSMERLNKEAKYEEYLLEYAELMLSKGLKLNYEKQIRDFQEKRKMAEDNLKQIADTLETLRDQLENGVETKEIKDEDITIQENEE